MSATEEFLASQILRTRIGVITRLAPRASLVDEAALKDLRDAAEYCMERRETQLVLDLATVQVLNSAALDAMIDIQERLVRHGGWLKVVNVTPIVTDIFHLTDFSRYVTNMDADRKELVGVASKSRRLGDILVARGLLTEERVAETVALQKKTAKRMGQIIVENGWVSEQDVLLALAEQLAIPFVRLRAGVYDPGMVALLDKEAARRLREIGRASCRERV